MSTPQTDPQVPLLKLLVKDYREILQEAVDLLLAFEGSRGWGEAEDEFLEKVEEWL